MSVKSPSFQFYPGDFLSDANVLVMSMAERGAYITLLCVCWQQGSLPNDMTRLSKLCGVPLSAFRKLWPALKPCFRSTKEYTSLIHPRLDRERQKQLEFRQRQSENGKQGGRPRNPGQSQDEKGLGYSGLSQTEPKKSSSVFCLPSSSSDFSQTQAHAREALLAEPNEIALRAGRFCEDTYPALYQKHRKGARYVGRPSLDFQEAQQLCRTWDDERLAKLAHVFLTTDHEFAEKGSRTMAQFRSLAPWCDSQLRERGL